MLKDLKASCARDLLESIGASSPAFFEDLVLDLLHAMGYGTGRQDLKRVGKTGDGGIDGIVPLDRLGLGKVYVQAKRWTGAVGAHVVRDFVGALSVHSATMGVLLTTGSFTRDARDIADKVAHSIVLVDGERLAHLMIDYGVGVTYQEYRAPRVSAEYFA